jgi:hypothetical protein
MRLRGFRASMLALAVAVAGMVSVVSAIPGFAAGNTTVVVAPADMENNPNPVLAYTNAQSNGRWFFYNDQDGGSDGPERVDSSLGSFVVGPANSLGVGSTQISVLGDKRRNLGTYRFQGTKLSDITELRYSTYNPSAGNGGSANRSGFLVMNISFNGSDTWQKRLTYVPNQNGTVIQNQWQEWNAGAGTALWGWSGYGGNGSQWPDGNTSVLRTWNDLKAAFPNIQIRTTDAFVGVRVGEPYADGYTENIDAFKFGTAAGSTTFDFEPYDVATDRDECKGKAWQNVTRADGSSFKNQGDCVSYTSNGR